MVGRGLLAGCLAGLALAAASPARAAAADPVMADRAPADLPARVVSMNLCTDQMAMLLAAPGQLVSVSHLARDPRSSAMAAQAAAYPLNHGQAEEILRLRPDLVLAGAWTNQTSVDLLRRVGVRVETFAPENDIPAIRDSLRRMGALLGRAPEAEALLADFDADLARLEGDAPDTRPRAALYAANGYTSGSDSLSGRIVALGGFANIADEAGIPGGGFLPLELLLLSRPDMMILDQPYTGHSRAEEILDHPALVSARASVPAAALSSPDWICGTPFILRAAAALRDARRELEP